ncbi:MAG: M1 family metallopeptidase [Polyangiaceae bacterium]|nr:M1 family metallopeptidase [Polyangiaceae bacterium]MCW5791521.1 M1 family metallopeptidase [Polyangiaceae bacterium]
MSSPHRYGSEQRGVRQREAPGWRGLRFARELLVGFIGLGLGLAALSAAADSVADGALDSAARGTDNSADGVLDGAAQGTDSSTDGTNLDSAADGVPSPVIGHTPREDAPRVLGARWEHDEAMPPPPPPVSHYTIDARLDEGTQKVTATARLRWKNTSQAQVTALFFHLYLNAFKHDRTLFLRSPYGAGRSGGGAADYGHIQVTRLTAREHPGVDLWQGAAPHSPGDPDDETDIEVPLPAPVPPGAELHLELAWEAKLPRLVERTGTSGDYFLVAQWFPKLARLEPDGRFRHFAFHPHAEFYADFSHYDVTLDVPAAAQVGASGQQIHEEIHGDRRRLRFQIEHAIDFAWTAWPGFLRREEQISGVRVHLLYPPGHTKNADDTLEAVRFGLAHFGRRYGAYPYPTLTVVHPPRHAARSGGMEYPSFITTGGRWSAGYVSRQVPAVTLHELAHQWFYGLVATDEPQWPFLDEGLTSYAELLAMSERYGDASLLRLPGLSVSQRAALRRVAAEYGRDGAIARPAADFSSFRSLGALVYARTATALDTLAAVYGREAMDAALARYARYYRYRHPGPPQLIAAIRETMGDDAARNLSLVLFERGSIDYRVRAIEPGSDGSTARVVVYRDGQLELPVEISLIAADGSETLERWSGRGASRELHFRGDSPLVQVVVDPRGLIGLDEQPLNNVVRLAPHGTPRVRERLTYAAQLALELLSP